MTEPTPILDPLLAYRQLRMLGELAELGLEQARALDRQIKKTDPEPPLADLQAAALAYTRVSRAVRMALLMQSELVDRKEGGARERRQARTEAQAEQRAEHTGRAVAVIERVAKQALPGEGYTVSLLTREAAHRLETDDIYGDVLKRPVGEIVALICNDLGLSPNWAALRQEAWAQKEAASGARGSPFARAAAFESAPLSDPDPPRRWPGRRASPARRPDSS